MTYAAFESFMVYVWAVWGCILVGFLLWAAWVFLWDEPRARRRRQREANILIARITPRDRA